MKVDDRGNMKFTKCIRCIIAQWPSGSKRWYLNVSYILCPRAIGSSLSTDNIFIHYLFIFIYNMMTLDSLGTFWASWRLHVMIIYSITVEWYCSLWIKEKEKKRHGEISLKIRRQNRKMKKDKYKNIHKWSNVCKCIVKRTYTYQTFDESLFKKKDWCVSNPFCRVRGTVS